MEFTVEDRYLPLPTYRTMKVLHLAKSKRKSHRLTAAKYVTSYKISLTAVNIIKYELQLKCMLVCCGRPLPGSHSSASANIFLYRSC